jgi:hypothetical protein
MTIFVPFWVCTVVCIYLGIWLLISGVCAVCGLFSLTDDPLFADYVVLSFIIFVCFIVTLVIGFSIVGIINTWH